MKKFRIEIKWAIIYTIFFIVWTFIEKVLGFHDTNIKNHIYFSSLYLIPMITMYVLEHSDKKKNTYQNVINFNQGFVSGCYLSLFICILSPLAQFICFEFISPNFFKNSIQHVVTSKTMTLENATNYFSLKSYMIQAAFSGISSGIIISGIVAYFLQTKTKK